MCVFMICVDNRLNSDDNQFVSKPSIFIHELTEGQGQTQPHPANEQKWSYISQHSSSVSNPFSSTEAVRLS